MEAFQLPVVGQQIRISLSPLAGHDRCPVGYSFFIQLVCINHIPTSFMWIMVQPDFFYSFKYSANRFS